METLAAALFYFLAVTRTGGMETAGPFASRAQCDDIRRIAVMQRAAASECWEVPIRLGDDNVMPWVRADEEGRILGGAHVGSVERLGVGWFRVTWHRRLDTDIYAVSCTVMIPGDRVCTAVTTRADVTIRIVDVNGALTSHPFSLAVVGR